MHTVGYEESQMEAVSPAGVGAVAQKPNPSARACFSASWKADEQEVSGG